jgi:predicted hydrocarbon binding protein
VVEHWRIDELEKLINKKLPETKKRSMVSRTLGNIISVLGKVFIRTQGYSTMKTILEREVRELGKKDAQELKKIFEFKEATKENVKKALNIAAIILGFKLDLLDGKVVAVKCPFHEALKEYEEPFMCNICVEYNIGMTEGLTQGKYTLKRLKWLFDGDEYCRFKPVARKYLKLRK